VREPLVKIKALVNVAIFILGPALMAGSFFVAKRRFGVDKNRRL
jgi:hypothetical protein